MLVLNILRRLFTGPVELLMEVLFSIGTRNFSETGPVIIPVCMMVSVPMILFCHWAGAPQIRGKMLPAKTKISRSAFIRQIMLPLLPEILHFTAAYLFFNDLVVLHGVPFLLISDLGIPDNMIQIDGYSLNVLPILVILIHVISNLIRMRDLPPVRKIPAFAVTGFYLYLLYNSSSGFTFYWMICEIMFLAFSILQRHRSAETVIVCLSSFAGFVILFFSLFFMQPDPHPERLAISVSALVFQIPALFLFLKRKGFLHIPAKITAVDKRLFLLCIVYLAIITGIQIPSQLIRSSPSDFINIANYYSPFHYIISALLIAAGTFIIWPGIAFLTAPDPARKILVFLSVSAAVCGTVNVMFFGNDRGIISTQFVYEKEPAESVKTAAANIIILLLILFVLWMISRRKEILLYYLMLTLCITKTVSGTANCIVIAQDLSVSKKTIASALRAPDDQEPGPDDDESRPLPEIPFSRDGRNVVVIMLDRSIGYFLPFIMGERPELAEQFDGFTFYPNTVSFGSKTNEAAPALFGGYEYTPERIKERSEESLAEKHNEALLLMPVLFEKAGYSVTVFDPPYAGYQAISDLSIYSDHPEIKAWHAEDMLPLSDEFYETEAIMDRNRNLFCYSFYRISPLFIQPVLYGKGSYNKADTIRSFEDLLTANRGLENFQKAYNVLMSLPTMTVTEDSGDNFFIMDNRTTHEPTLLQLPDYELTNHVDNTPYETVPVTRTSVDGRILHLDDIEQEKHYHINMASFIALGSWLDHLRENGVYDNTRIIIVSDHGHPLGYSEFMFGSKSYEEVLTFNPILMVKDFYGRGFSIDEKFMTNADTPVIAFEGLIKDPVNPATGHPVTDADKYSRDILIKHTEVWNIKLNNGDEFLPGDWYRFNGHDIFDTGKWEYIGRH